MSYSCDPVSDLMRNGDLVEQEQDLRDLPRQLTARFTESVTYLPNEAYDRWFEALVQSGETASRFTPKPATRRIATEAEHADVARYGVDIYERVQRMLRTLDDFKRQAAELADVAEVLHRCALGQRVTSDVHAAILRFGRTMENIGTFACALADHEVAAGAVPVDAASLALLREKLNLSREPKK